MTLVKIFKIETNFKDLKFIDIEYFIGFILAISLWGYHLFQTAIISQEIAKDCNIKL